MVECNTHSKRANSRHNGRQLVSREVRNESIFTALRDYDPV